MLFSDQLKVVDLMARDGCKIGLRAGNTYAWFMPDVHLADAKEVIGLVFLYVKVLRNMGGV